MSEIEVPTHAAAGFELAPVLGQAVGNPMVRQFFAGVQVGHGLTRHLGLEGAVTYSPDFGERDVKDLTTVLVAIADLTGTGDGDFQQPFDHLSLAASLTFTETAYGNLDWFGRGPVWVSATAQLGGGVLVNRAYVACSPTGPTGTNCPGDPAAAVQILRGEREVKPAVVLGGRFDVKVTSRTSFRLELRDLVYVAAAPDFDASGNDGSSGPALYHDVLATMGVAFRPKPLDAARWDPTPRPERLVLPDPLPVRPAGPVELGLAAGGVLNDPFLRRSVATGALTWHVTERFAARLTAGFSPDFGEGDYKPRAEWLVHENRVSPDVSKIKGFAGARAEFTPIQGTLWKSRGEAGRFALSYGLGFGAVRSVDDLEIIQCPGDAQCEATKRQVHPTTTFGPSAQLWVSDRTSLTLDLGTLVYIETIASTVLEMKNGLLLTAGLTVALPGRRPPRDDEPPPPSRRERLSPSRGLFVRADLGATSYLGAFGPSPYGPILNTGSRASVAFGGDRGSTSERTALAWQVELATGVHNGLNWQTYAACIDAEQCAPNPLQGDTRTFAGLVIGTYAWTPHPRLGLGIRAGGGVMAAPLRLSALGAEEAEAAFGGPLTAHRTAHPEVLLGPTVEFRTYVPGLSVGVNADVSYALGFDYGTSVTGFARYRLPR